MEEDAFNVKNCLEDELTFSPDLSPGGQSFFLSLLACQNGHFHQVSTIIPIPRRTPSDKP